MRHCLEMEKERDWAAGIPYLLAGGALRDWAAGIPYALAAGLLKIKESEAMPPFFCAALSLVSKLTVKCAHKKIARFSSRDSLVLRRERDSNPRTLSGQRFSRPPHSTTLPSLQFPFGTAKVEINLYSAKNIVLFFRKEFPLEDHEV